jgi:D-glycero-D-manno-heptose 1,7-bisphosphate phosphatase
MLILLDRDGVINTDIVPHGTTHIDALQVYEFVPAALYQLKARGFKVAVVTNQSAVGKGLIDVDMLHKIHTRIQEVCRAYHADAVIDAFYYCTDAPQHPTHRRKPEAGMLWEALHDFGANPSHTPFVGDSRRDIEAALRAGCPPYLVSTGKGKDTDAQWQGAKPYQLHDTLADVARSLTK